MARGGSLRLEELRSGKVSAIPWDEVREKALTFLQDQTPPLSSSSTHFRGYQLASFCLTMRLGSDILVAEPALDPVTVSANLTPGPCKLGTGVS